MLEKYLDEILSWNKKINLVSRKASRSDIIKHHIGDSLIISNYFDFSKPLRIIDIGAGAGFPGIPLKIMFPDISLTLVDSTRKKVDFLNHIIGILNLSNTDAIWDRAENLTKNKKYMENFDVAFARAVSNLKTISEYCLPFLKRGGTFIVQKGKDIENELKEAKKTMTFLGGYVTNIIKLTDSESSKQKTLILIKKFKSCVKNPH